MYRYRLATAYSNDHGCVKHLEYSREGKKSFLVHLPLSPPHEPSGERVTVGNAAVVVVAVSFADVNVADALCSCQIVNDTPRHRSQSSNHSFHIPSSNLQVSYLHMCSLYYWHRTNNWVRCRKLHPYTKVLSQCPVPTTARSLKDVSWIGADHVP